MRNSPGGTWRNFMPTEFTIVAPAPGWAGIVAPAPVTEAGPDAGAVAAIAGGGVLGTSRLHPQARKAAPARMPAMPTRNALCRWFMWIHVIAFG
jgi:hypothetical protein